MYSVLSLGVVLGIHWGTDSRGLCPHTIDVSGGGEVGSEQPRFRSQTACVESWLHHTSCVILDNLVPPCLSFPSIIKEMPLAFTLWGEGEA